MKRKTMIPVLIFAFSVTILVVVASIRGNLFQASLLSGDEIQVGSGSTFTAPSLATSTGVALQEFPIFSERTSVYRSALLGSEETNNVGFYFPSIYRFEDAGSGLISLAFKPGTDVLVEKSLRLTLSYPGKVMKYVGETSATSSGATLTVDNTQPNVLVVELTPAQGVVWRFNQEVSPFLQLPMAIENTGQLLPTSGLQLRITNVEHIGFDNTITPWPFAQAPVDILYYTPAGDPTSRRVPTSEARVPGQEERGVLTMEMKAAPAKPANETSNVNTNTATGVQTAGTATAQAGVQAFRMPLVTQDQTRVSPPLIREKSRETVFVYLSVADPDGQNDIKAVEMNLTGFGLAARVPLVQVSTGPKYSVFGGSFVLPDSVTSRAEPYEIPYTITDGGSNVLQGALKFVIRAALTEGQATTVTGLGSSTAGGVTGASLLNETSGNNNTRTNTSGRPDALDIETDLNGDGKVDQTDLSIYLFTFNLDRD